VKSVPGAVISEPQREKTATKKREMAAHNDDVSPLREMGENIQI
jgi:hypothetical protein